MRGGAGRPDGRVRVFGAESALLNSRTEFLLCWDLRASLRITSRVAHVRSDRSAQRIALLVELSSKKTNFSSSVPRATISTKWLATVMLEKQPTHCQPRFRTSGRVVGGPMRAVIRSILAVIAGFVAASVVMMIVETANGRLLYPELGKRAEGVTDRQEIKAIMASAPVGALLVVLIGWALGSVAGGFLATLISRKPPGGHALVLGALLTLAGVANNLMLPPPFWFWIATFAVLLPATYVGAGLFRGGSLPGPPRADKRTSCVLGRDLITIGGLPRSEAPRRNLAVFGLRASVRPAARGGDLAATSQFCVMPLTPRIRQKTP